MSQTDSHHVIVRLDVYVDREAWRDIYGLEEESTRAVEEAVRDYAVSQLADSAAAEDGAILTVGRRG